MKIAFVTVLFVIWLLLISQVEITFKPFSISLPYWHRAVGILLIIIGIWLYNTGELFSGYKQGYNDGIKKTIEYLKDKSKA